MENNQRKQRLYGRRLGRPLKQERVEVLDTLLPQLQIPPSFATNPTDLFPHQAQALWFEIGFGNGEHLTALLERHDDRCFIGAEPFVNGMAAFLKSIKDRPDWHDRIRVVMDDALPVINALPEHSLDGIYVLNPDPWPKKRHYKRRIISQENLDIFAKVLKPGGQLIMTTDVDDLAEWMVTEASRHPAFKWTAQNADDWKKAPKDWVQTRYEEKGSIAGRKQSYLIFERKFRTRIF